MASVGLSCTVGPQSASDMIVDGFGLGTDARVQEETSGTLGGKVSGTITNNAARRYPPTTPLRFR